MTHLRDPLDPLQTFFDRCGVAPLPWDVHHTLLWAVHPKADPHRAYVLDAVARGKLSDEQGRAVLEFLDRQARGYLTRHRREQAETIAEFGKSLAGAAGAHEHALAFSSLAARARWAEPRLGQHGA